MHLRRVVLSSVACSAAQYFPTLSHKLHDSRQMLFNTKYRLWPVRSFANGSKICTNCTNGPKNCTNCTIGPKNCTNGPKNCTNGPKNCTNCTIGPKYCTNQALIWRLQCSIITRTSIVFGIEVCTRTSRPHLYTLLVPATVMY
jgi:hypothetical protein